MKYVLSVVTVTGILMVLAVIIIQHHTDVRKALTLYSTDQLIRDNSPADLMKFGLDTLDTMLFPISDDDIVGPIIAPIGFTCGCQWSRTLYVSVDGFVTLGKQWKIPSTPGSQSLGDLPHGTQLIAPLWTDMKIEQWTSYIWYHVYYRYELGNSYFPQELDELYHIQNGTQPLPIQAIIVTWENMAPADATELFSELLTFQLVLLTDAVTTYAVYNYGSSNWLLSNSGVRPMAIAWQCTEVTAFSNIIPLSPGVYRDTFSLESRSPLERLSFMLGDCQTANMSQSNLCVLRREDREHLSRTGEWASFCPCYLSQAKKDRQFGVTQNQQCYSVEVATEQTVENDLCCYHEEKNGGLLISQLWEDVETVQYAETVWRMRNVERVFVSDRPTTMTPDGKTRETTQARSSTRETTATSETPSSTRATPMSTLTSVTFHTLSSSSTPSVKTTTTSTTDRHTTAVQTSTKSSTPSQITPSKTTPSQTTKSSTLSQTQATTSEQPNSTNKTSLSPTQTSTLSKSNPTATISTPIETSTLTKSNPNRTASTPIETSTLSKSNPNRTASTPIETSTLTKSNPNGTASTPIETSTLSKSNQTSTMAPPETTSIPIDTSTLTKTKTPTVNTSKTSTSVKTSVKTSTPVTTSVKSSTPLKTSVETSTPVKTSVETSTPVKTSVETSTPVKTSVETSTPVKTSVETSTPVKTSVETSTPVKTSVETSTHVKTSVKTSVETSTPVKTSVKTSVETSTPVITTVKTSASVKTSVKTSLETSTPVITTVKTSTPVKTSVKTSVETSTPVKTSVKTSVETSTPVITTVKTSTPVKTSVKTSVETSTPVITTVKTSTPVKTSVKTSTPVITSVKTSVETSTPVKTSVETSTPVKTSVETSTPVKTSVETSTPVITTVKTSTSVKTSVKTSVETSTPVKTSMFTQTSIPTENTTPVRTSTPIKPSTISPSSSITTLAGPGTSDTSPTVQTNTDTTTLQQESTTTGQPGQSSSTVTTSAPAPSGLVVFGETAGDTLLSFLTDDTIVGPLLVPVEFSCGCHSSRTLYVSVDGFVILGDPWTNAPPKPQPVPISALPSASRLIAPLWADMAMKPGASQVWYQAYYKYLPSQSTFLSALDSLYASTTGSQLSPVQAFIVTWVNMLPIDVPDTSNELLTFQLVLITDAVNTYAIFNYGSSSWLPAQSVVRPAAMAWQCSDTQSYNNLMSLTSSIYTQAYSSGNTGITGRWSFKLDECPVTSNNYHNLCYKWRYDEELDPVSRDLPGQLDQLTANCPCHVNQVLQDDRFIVTQDQKNCYATVFPATDAFGYRKCCYDNNSAGALYTSLPQAGYLSVYNPIASPIQHQQQDLLPYSWCCESSDLCSVFISRRPVDNCDTYEPPVVCTTYGEPHILTLDGRSYTYNGVGEYTLVQIVDISGQAVFQLQGRTEKLVSRTGRAIQGTIFTSVAGEDKLSGGYFHVEVNLNKTGFNIFANSYSSQVDGTQDFYSGRVLRHDNVMIRRTGNDSLTAVLRNGISVNIELHFGLFDIALMVPLDLRQGTSTSGLLGNNDNDPTNDFQTPEGLILPNNITEQEIYEYGELWRVDAINSILHYRVGLGHSDYQDPSFVPVFLNNFSPQQQEAATQFCGSEVSSSCVFDLLATEDTNIANSTKTYKSLVDTMVHLSNDHAPSVSAVPQQIFVEVNQSVDILIQATDLDDDDLTLYFEGLTLTPVTLQERGSVSLRYNWTPVNSNPIYPVFYAVDSVGVSSARHELELFVCPGCNHGYCNYNNTVGGAQFTLVPCQCNTGWTGDDCSADKDACQTGPCSVGTYCTDLSPEEEAVRGIAFTCTCEEGFETIPGVDRCQDVDECSQGLSSCDQGCVNTLGSYHCTCETGYRQIQELCVDIDECVDGTSSCQHICINTDAGYQCSCEDGYFLNTDNHTCNISVILAALCGRVSCDQGCKESSDGTVVCRCDVGFRLATDQSTCEDVNECSELQSCAQTCTNLVGSFSCGCLSGYKLSHDNITCEVCEIGRWGTNCQYTCIECSQNMERCDPVRGCVCRQGWEGPLCNINTDECADSVDPCSDPLMVCEDRDGSYSCVCGSGYEKTAEGTCQNIDECSGGHDCPVGISTCVDLVPGFTCQCVEGYQGDGYNCSNIDECAGELSLCDHVCQDRIGSYNCECYIGYILDDDRRSCIPNIDPCEGYTVTTETCQQQGAHGCKIENGSPECFCRLGYQITQNGACEDIDECSGTSLCTEECTNLPGTFQCSCSRGRRLSQDKITCQACNITNSWGPACENKCNCGTGSLFCDSEVGCRCAAGWTGSQCNIDINDCDRQPCLGNQQCVNTPGSYSCSCEAGYQHNKEECVDIDECIVGTDVCSQRCVNTLGSYTCSCRSGYTLKNDSDCINLDECLLGSSGCQQNCVDLEGSYLCTCTLGFLLLPDKMSCERDPSTDQCANVSHSCEYGCLLQQGQPVCFCRTGYQLNSADRRSCQAVYTSLEVTLALSLEFLTVYDVQGSIEYKDLASDLRTTPALTHYHIACFKYNDDRPGFEVEHSVVFSVRNISEAEILMVARVLRDQRDLNMSVHVGQAARYLTREPTITRLGSQVKDPVTCLLCSRSSDCVLVDVEEDSYSCPAPIDVSSTAEVEIEVHLEFLTIYTDMLSAEYVLLANSVRTALSSLFTGVKGFEGLGSIRFRRGSLERNESVVIQTYVKFNSTVQQLDILRVSEQLQALIVGQCLQLGEECVEIIGDILVLEKPAICWTCDSNEVCQDTRETTQERGETTQERQYVCIAVATSPAAMGAADTGSTGLLLGLGLGLPLMLIFVVICIAIMWYCSRRQRLHSYQAMTSTASSFSADFYTSNSPSLSTTYRKPHQTGPRLVTAHRKPRQTGARLVTASRRTPVVPASVINYYTPYNLEASAPVHVNPVQPESVSLIDHTQPPGPVLDQIQRGPVSPIDQTQPDQTQPGPVSPMGQTPPPMSSPGASEASNFPCHVFYKVLDPDFKFKIKRPQVNPDPVEISNNMNVDRESEDSWRQADVLW